MSLELTILVPVLKRPHRVVPFMESALAATPDAEVLFIADPDDRRELDALEAAGADYIVHNGGYAAKINCAVEQTDRPYIFTAADDLLPHEGWYEIARRYMKGRVQVVGTNDLCSERVRRGFHATHFLMTREYAEMPCIDGTLGPLFEGYDHSFVDDELVWTAEKRKCLAFATDSIVEHQHPDNGTAPMDSTYRKGRARMNLDGRLYMKRRAMWRSAS